MLRLVPFECVTPPEAAKEEQFRAVFQSCLPKVVAYASRRVPAHDVDDVAAATFLVVWQRWDDVPAGQGTLPWVYAVAGRIISQHHRSGSRWCRLRGLLAGLGPAMEPALDLVFDDQVADTLARLRPTDRALLVLSYWEDLAPAEIAQMLGISTNAASIRLHRARKRFAAAWDPWPDGELAPFDGTEP